MLVEQDAIFVNLSAKGHDTLKDGDPLRAVAYPITFAGFEDFKFVIDQRLALEESKDDECGEDGWDGHYSEWWVVSELSTGHVVNLGYSRDEAIEKARATLAERGREAVAEAIAKQLSQWGNYNPAA